MTKLNAPESALLLAQLAMQELKSANDLKGQLAKLRLQRMIDALQGRVDMEEYERKILGGPA